MSARQVLNSQLQGKGTRSRMGFEVWSKSQVTWRIVPLVKALEVPRYRIIFYTCDQLFQKEHERSQPMDCLAMVQQGCRLRVSWGKLPPRGKFPLFCYWKTSTHIDTQKMARELCLRCLFTSFIELHKYFHKALCHYNIVVLLLNIFF